MLNTELESRVVLTTVTATREPLGPDDENICDVALFQAGVTIVTKADGDNNQEDYDDDDDIVAFAGTTTVTESRGDHESDPEDDDVEAQVVHLSHGESRPLLYRFAEVVAGSALRVRYDDSAQVSVLSDGRTVVSVLLERNSRN